MNKITEGNRHTECHRIATYLTEKGVDWATVEYLMLGWAFTYTSPPLSGMEVRKVLDSVVAAAEHKRQAQRRNETRESYSQSPGLGWSND